MRRFGTILFLLGLFLLNQPLQAKIHLKGNWESSLYAWQPENSKLADFYQGLSFRYLPLEGKKITLQGYWRFARMGDPASWDTRMYNTYLKWRSNGGKWQIRLGRQFVQEGAISGTVDGLHLLMQPRRDLSLRLLVGTSAPEDRAAEFQKWSEAKSFGIYGRWRFSSLLRASISLFQKSRHSEVAWQLATLALNGQFKQNFFYQTRFDYNLKQSDLQGARVRLMYQKAKWNVTGEINSQKPRVYEDSPFLRYFELRAYNQFRAGIGYQWGIIDLGVQYLFTRYAEESDDNHQGILTAATRWGMIGLVLQDGGGGQNTGIFGEINYPLLPNLQIDVRSSYYKYQRYTMVVSEDATAFSAGLRYRPWAKLLLQTEIRQNLNSYYKNDWRGLFRLAYAFDL